MKHQPRPRSFKTFAGVLGSFLGFKRKRGHEPDAHLAPKARPEPEPRVTYVDGRTYSYREWCRLRNRRRMVRASRRANR